MKLLLDTHAFLWAIALPSKLSARAVKLLNDDRQPLLLSVVTLWEIVLKQQAGKLELPATAEYFRAHMSQLGVKEILPVQPAHIYRLHELPLHHKDPFDRLLVAQCQVEGLALLSGDPVMKRYSVESVW